MLVARVLPEGPWCREAMYCVILHVALKNKLSGAQRLFFCSCASTRTSYIAERKQSCEKHSTRSARCRNSGFDGLRDEYSTFISRWILCLMLLPQQATTVKRTSAVLHDFLEVFAR